VGPRHPWTKEEDAILLDAMKNKLPEQSVRSICFGLATTITGRTKHAIQGRWRNLERKMGKQSEHATVGRGSNRKKMMSENDDDEDDDEDDNDEGSDEDSPNSDDDDDDQADSRAGFPWTSEEDRIVLEAMTNKPSNKNFNQVAIGLEEKRKLPGRSKDAIISRWTTLKRINRQHGVARASAATARNHQDDDDGDLDSSKAGRWTIEQDAALLRTIEDWLDSPQPQMALTNRLRECTITGRDRNGNGAPGRWNLLQKKHADGKLDPTTRDRVTKIMQRLKRSAGRLSEPSSAPSRPAGSDRQSLPTTTTIWYGEDGVYSSNKRTKISSSSSPADVGAASFPASSSSTTPVVASSSTSSSQTPLVPTMTARPSSSSAVAAAAPASLSSSQAAHVAAVSPAVQRPVAAGQSEPDWSEVLATILEFTNDPNTSTIDLLFAVATAFDGYVSFHSGDQGLQDRVDKVLGELEQARVVNEAQMRNVLNRAARTTNATELLNNLEKQLKVLRVILKVPGRPSSSS